MVVTVCGLILATFGLWQIGSTVLAEQSSSSPESCATSRIKTIYDSLDSWPAPLKLTNSVVATLPASNVDETDSEVLGANDQETDWEEVDVTSTITKQLTPALIAPTPTPSPQPKWWQF